MLNVLSALWMDERGFLVSAELIIIATILVIGLIVGLSTLQSAIVWEFQDLAWAFSSLNQNFRTVGFRGCKGSFHPGSFFFGSLNRFCPVVSNVGYGGLGYGGGVGGFGGSDFGVGGGVNYGYGGMEIPGPIRATPVPVNPCPPGTDCPTGQITAPVPCENCNNGSVPSSTGPLQPVPMLAPPGPQPQAEPRPEAVEQRPGPAAAN